MDENREYASVVLEFLGPTWVQSKSLCVPDSEYTIHAKGRTMPTWPFNGYYSTVKDCWIGRMPHFNNSEFSCDMIGSTQLAIQDKHDNVIYIDLHDPLSKDKLNEFISSHSNI